MPAQSLISVIGEKSLNLSDLELYRLFISGCYFLLAWLLVTIQSDNVHKRAERGAWTERRAHTLSHLYAADKRVMMTVVTG